MSVSNLNINKPNFVDTVPKITSVIMLCLDPSVPDTNGDSERDQYERARISRKLDRICSSIRVLINLQNSILGNIQLVMDTAR